MQPNLSQDMIINHIKPINKNSLICTFELVIPKWGNFVIREMCFFKKGDQKWITFPSRKYEKDGQTKYFSLNAFSANDTQDAFQKKVIAILEPTTSIWLHSRLMNG